MYVSYVVVAILEMAGNFDKNIEQIPYLVLGEVFLEVSAIFDDLVQR